MVRPTGFYRNKANALIRLGQELVARFDGEVPATMEELVTLPGVGRKTANVILGNAFGIPGITVDTHFGRLVRRWRWTELEDPVKVEHAIGDLIERSEWTAAEPPGDLPRPAGVPCPQAGLRRLRAGQGLPVVRHRADRPAGRRAVGQGPGNRAPVRAGRPVADRPTYEYVDPLDRCGAGRRGRARGRRCGPTRIENGSHRTPDRAAAPVSIAMPTLPRRSPARGRGRSEPCPADGAGDGPQKLRGITVECAGDGSEVDVARALAGRTMVLNLWAYWCGPCAEELPAMAEYQRRVGPAVTVLTVHQDENETAALAAPGGAGRAAADAAGRQAAYRRCAAGAERDARDGGAARGR